MSRSTNTELHALYKETTSFAVETSASSRARCLWLGCKQYSSKPDLCDLYALLDSEDGHDPVCLPGPRNTHKGTPSC